MYFFFLLNLKLLPVRKWGKKKFAAWKTMAAFSLRRWLLYMFSYYKTCRRRNSTIRNVTLWANFLVWPWSAAWILHTGLRFLKVVVARWGQWCLFLAQWVALMHNERKGLLQKIQALGDGCLSGVLLCKIGLPDSMSWSADKDSESRAMIFPSRQTQLPDNHGWHLGWYTSS